MKLTKTSLESLKETDNLDPEITKDLIKLALEAIEFKKRHYEAGCPTGQHCRWECPGDHGK